MFAAILGAGKLERALDLVERLHLEKSFELAMTIADNHRKLVDLIEDVKYRRFPLDDMGYPAEGDDDDDHIAIATNDYAQSHSDRPRISPDNSSLLKRNLHDTQERQVRPKQSFR
jgi:chromosome transmission fidelity protein 4